MVDSVVSFVVDHLSQLVVSEAKLLYGVEDKVKLLQNELQMINELLKTSKSKEGISNVVANQIRDVAHQAEDVIDTFVTKVTIYNRRTMPGRVLRVLGQARSLHHVNDKIDEIKTTLSEIRNNKETYVALKEENNSQSATEEEKEKERAQSLHELRKNVEEEHVVGFVDDSKAVIKLLLEGGSNRNVVSIIGMGGLGKTTLARKVYNNSKVKQHFKSRAWVYVSNECRVEELFLALLKQLMPNFEEQYTSNKKGKENTPDNSSSNEEVELKKLVQNSLESIRYLVVVDDMWKRQDWEKVQDAFPDKNNGSRILITSRSRVVAYDLPYYLHFLSEDESWELFCRKVFSGEDYPSDLEDLGRQMVQSCRGLPLSIIVLAGLIAYKEKSHREWSKVVGHVNWYLTQDETQVKDIVLKLSYDNLPRRLKPCFLYLGIFPEDFEIPVTPLLQKWVAEGFIQDTGNRDPDDVAEDYLYELIDRSLVQVAKVKTNGGLKTCQVHDLLRDLCISESKKDKFLEVCTGNNILNSTKPRRLSIHSKMDHYISLSNIDHSSIRSLFLFDTDIDVKDAKWRWLSKDFELLRVLEVRPSLFYISYNLGNFIHLRYLRINLRYAMFVPTSILDLWNLQTIDIGSSMSPFPISFPAKIWKLKYLRHLNTHQSMELRGKCSGSDEKMWNLQTISYIELNKQGISLMMKGTFPNLKRVGLIMTSGYKCEFPKLLQRLQQQSSHLNKLEIIFQYRNDKGVEEGVHEIVERNNGCRVQEQLQGLGQFNSLTCLKIRNASDLLTRVLAFPPNITELKLSNITCITDEGMNHLGNHTKLKFLKLSGKVLGKEENSFDLNCEGGSFPQLEVFKMKYLKLRKWELGNGGMSRLQRVIIYGCPWLDNIPNELWSLSGLRKVKATRVSTQIEYRLRDLEISNGVELVIEYI